MDIAHGFGMLGVGLIAILIGGTIIFLVINRIQRLEKEEKEKTTILDLFKRLK
jgi:hypothetical protein|tara:strand:+ start:450 stop:608 length:159 start_codon:yes stop_codon:yes gene_type:complete